MKFILRIFLVFVICASFHSCKKGCTDCNATNYSSEAKRDDGSCNFLNQEKVGFYAVTDTLIDWSETVWSETYSIEIKHGSCDQNHLIIRNFSGVQDQSTGEPIEVVAEIIGDSISILAQEIDADGIEGDSWGDYSIFKSSGYFSGDSIYFEMSYTGVGGDANYGWVSGTKD